MILSEQRCRACGESVNCRGKKDWQHIGAARTTSASRTETQGEKEFVLAAVICSVMRSSSVARRWPLRSSWHTNSMETSVQNLSSLSKCTITDGFKRTVVFRSSEEVRSRSLLRASAFLKSWTLGEPKAAA